MSILDNLKNTIKNYENNNEIYKQVLNNSNKIENLQNIPELQRKEISPVLITNNNPNISESKAKLIIDLLPLNEIYLEIIYAKEVKTSQEYFIVPTTQYLWIISMNGYNRYQYESLKVEIIKKSILSKTINLSNYIFEVSNNDEKINNLINIINDPNYRTNLINNTREIYGENEIFRTLNNIGSGISYDKDYNIRFYSKNLNKKYNIKELNNYELLIDNNVIQEKRLSQNARITSSKNSCYEIKIRITPKDNNIFEIPILEKDSMSTLYPNTSDKYIRNIKYGKDIMKIIDDLNDELIYGKKKED